MNNGGLRGDQSCRDVVRYQAAAQPFQGDALQGKVERALAKNCLALVIHDRVSGCGQSFDRAQHFALAASMILPGTVDAKNRGNFTCHQGSNQHRFKPGVGGRTRQTLLLGIAPAAQRSKTCGHNQQDQRWNGWQVILHGEQRPKAHQKDRVGTSSQHEDSSLNPPRISQATRSQQQGTGRHEQPRQTKRKEERAPAQPPLVLHQARQNVV